MYLFSRTKNAGEVLAEAARLVGRTNTTFRLNRPKQRTPPDGKTVSAVVTNEVEVSFDDLRIDDRVVVKDFDHNAYGALGKVYWLDRDTHLVSVVTDGNVDVWEGYADGLVKIVN